MPRTKSFSSTLTKICELAEQITILLNGAQDEFDKLAADSARLKEIEPALLKFQNALKPPTKQPEVPPTGEAPVTEQTISGQPEKPKRQRAKKAPASDVPEAT